MSDIKDKIKKLLKKAKDAGDIDMIELAMELLDEIPVPEPPFPSANQEPVEVKSRHPNGYEEFAMNQVNSKQPKPVQVKKRENKFKDTGEHKDIETPTVQLTERRRPAFKKVDQTCSRCSRSVEVHPQHVREFYVCDRCLRR
jgi:hypothetical protein